MSLLSMVPTIAQPLTTTQFFPPRRRKEKLKSAHAQSLEGLTAGPPPVATKILPSPMQGNFNPTAFIPRLQTFTGSNENSFSPFMREDLESTIASSEWNNSFNFGQHNDVWNLENSPISSPLLRRSSRLHEKPQINYKTAHSEGYGEHKYGGHKNT